mmetsp:Transcript_22106/g.40537  ORF Transcript_22106/g.40537 Transcript_22106/m.40537 type:complete len:93 (-) Transcript_22106:268-546(-)
MHKETPAQQLDFQHYLEHIVSFASTVVGMDGLVPRHAAPAQGCSTRDITGLHGTIFIWGPHMTSEHFGNNGADPSDTTLMMPPVPYMEERCG